MFAIIPLGGMLLAWAIVYAVMRNKRHQTGAQREVQLALLNKFSSGDEMTRFLSTEEGRQFVDRLAAPSDNDPRQRIAGMVTGGCVLVALSIGFFSLSVYRPSGADFVIPAVVIGAVGLGLFAGAALSLRISKKLGLIKDS